MAYRQVTAGRESLDLLHRLQLSPQSTKSDTVLEWTELHIDSADIDNLPESIDRCRNVKKIYASRNMLSSLPQSISNLPHLTVLDLSHNAFTTFPIALCGLTNLEELNLSDNQLSDIPGEDITSLKGLRILFLDNNAFATFPEELCDLTNLEELHLSDNKLSDIPGDITRLKGLRILFLDNNSFATFPKELCGLTNLEKLYLFFNQLSDIPVDIARMEGLRLFWLHENAFTIFPIALCGLTKLEELDMVDNELSEIPVDINRMEGLRIFWVHDNAFTTFPIALCGLIGLEKLDLSHNKLSDVPVDISKMEGLKLFWLNNNDYTTFPIALCGLTNLEKLYLDNNKLSDIPEDITKMTKLQILKLESNNITHLPRQICNMETNLNVTDNPLVQPPKHIANRGLGAIKRYFEALTDTNAIQSSRIQVSFLGETEAGKTSISRTLQLGQSILTKKADRTRVVEQGTWEADEDIAFNINDFGGHDAYRIGHPIFISTSGLVFVTFNLSKYDAGNEGHFKLHIGDWIDKGQAQMPGIQIALIGTHLDEVEITQVETKCSAINRKLEEHADEKKRWYQAQKETCENKMKEIPEAQKSLRQAYQSKADHLETLHGQMQPIYEHIFTVSSKTYKGVPELRDYLVTFARTSAEFLPEMWVEAAKNICTKKTEGSENTLSWEVIEDLILQNAPTSWKKMSKEDKEQTIYDILSFLAHRGDIIWYDRCPSLMKVVFHKQEILVNVLKAVLTHDKDEVSQKLQKSMKITKREASEIEEDIFSRGIVSKQAMSCLCESFKLLSTEVDVMTELMQKLELCYQVQEDDSLPSNTSFHFPWLLSEERQPELDTKWPSKVPPDTIQLTLQVLFRYKCPDGLYEKFSVRQHKHLGLMKTMRMDWKDGVYAKLEQCKMQMTRGQNQANSNAVSQDPDWVISIAVRGSHLSDLWGVLTQGHSDLMDIIKEDWPGLSYSKYLVCPHCVSEESQDPTLFPGEILDLTLGTASKPRQVLCVNTGVSIPADLVYPPSWQEVLRNEKPKLCENITEPCLLDMLDVFLQEGIITNREAETVKTEPSTDRVKCPKKVEVFLDIITRKPVKAYVTLCRCLQEQEQTDLLELIQ
ncbi:malignant fibrous histiocytoma-amplified sequence 1 homolog [Lingula anatina]|uniref:Malignant fibrous histiocytoma-amplified sequence 1 homolog n=1 Tax=Lingula anatina TaxID=7574 RepID=A0A1S3IA90_LINAN|nr:malignant fibrous histiocytoma-amplified sequence 1 homolog [Lingula anatina]|eukprot:XP_013395177.1 malignant fibrous histiocytoma-amplified sequence 1 homolog [Lingula anatina]